MLHDDDQIGDSSLPFTSLPCYPSLRRSSRSCSLPSPHKSIPQYLVRNSSQQHLYQPPTISPLDKASTLPYPSTAAFAGLDTEHSALPHHYTGYIGNHLTSPGLSANYETSTSHSTSLLEDWIDQTRLDTSSGTLAKSLESIPPFTQPSSPTTPLLGKRKRSLSPPNQEPQDAEPLPLTRRLLRLHTKNMASNSALKTPTKGDSQGSAAGPPTSTSKATTTNSKDNPKWVKMRMEYHEIHREIVLLNLAKYEDFKEDVSSQIASIRGSGTKPAESSTFKEAYNDAITARVTEASFKRDMLKHIIKDDFQVLADPGDLAKGINAVYESRNIPGAGIYCQAEQPFRRGFLPHTYPTNVYSPGAIAAKLFDDGMSSSKPDGTWGFFGRALGPTSTKIEADVQALLTVCPGIHCPFFILEVKMDNGSMELCRNQAARGCATVVNTMRQLLRMLGREDTLGPDKDTYVYCATMNEDFMEWWVGWAEVCEDHKVKYHMSRLRIELFAQDDPLKVMRRLTHNIMEWGLMTRLPMVKQLVLDLQAKAKLTESLAEKQAMDPPESSSPTKKRKSKHSSSTEVEE